MDDNLKSVGDLVNEALAQDNDPTIKEGVQTEVEVKEDPIETPAPDPIVPSTGTDALEAPHIPQEVVADTPVNGSPVIEEVDISSQLEQTFPGRGFKTWDDVKNSNINDKILESEKSNSRIKELEELNNDYSNKLNQKLNPWANQEMAELNEFVKETGITDTSLFSTLKGADLKSMEARRILEINMSKDNPNLSQRQIQEYIDDNYNQIKQDFSHVDDEDERRIKEDAQDRAIRRGETNLEIDANKARTELIGLQGKIKSVDLAADLESNQKAHQEKVEALTKEWTPHINQSIQELRQFKIEIDNNGEGKELAKFEIPADKLPVYANQAMQWAVNNDIDPATNDGRSQVNEFMANIALIDNRNQIIQKTYNAARSDMELELEKEISNPTGDTLPPNPDQSPSRDPKPKTVGDLEEEAYLGAMKQIDTGNY